MEYVSGGELFDRIVEKEFYSEKDAAQVIKTVSLALKHCHDRGIVHRDLKPENLLLTKNEKGVVEDGNIKLADFGFSKQLPNKSRKDGLTTSCGTPGYVAPEILKGFVYGKEVDLWSLGVILYILLCGYPPFIEEGNTGMTGLFEKIKKGNYSFTPVEYWKDVSEDGKNLIRKLLKVDPSERLTIEEVLNNNWVKMDKFEVEKADNDISQALKQMRKYQAKKKWRMGFNAITAANRISALISPSREGSSNEEKKETIIEVEVESKAATDSVTESKVNAESKITENGNDLENSKVPEMNTETATVPS